MTPVEGTPSGEPVTPGSGRGSERKTSWRAWHGRTLRTLAAAAIGVLLALSFPPADLSWLAPLAVAALTVLVYRRRPGAAFAYGSVTGLVFFLVLCSWLRVIGDDAWVALSAVCALFLGLTALGTALITRLPYWPVWVGAVWVAAEALRDRAPLGGFPWGRLAYAETDSVFTGLAALGGAPLVTFAVAVVGALLAYLSMLLWHSISREESRPAGEVRRAVVSGGVALVVAVGVAFAGVLVPRPTAGETDGGSATATIAVVQGDVPAAGDGGVGERRAVLANHIAATDDLIAAVRAGTTPAPDVVIWPENAADVNPYTDAEAATEIDDLVDRLGVPLLVGALVDHPGDATLVDNSAILWTPGGGPGATYVKRHPVPFGEYIPFRSVLAPLISRLDQIPRDFAAGTRVGEIDAAGIDLGVVICFEIAYDDLVTDTVRDGGRVLVVQTNNATYEGTGQPEQQLAMSRLRAVEHGRSVAIAATTGISALIAPDGSVIAQSQEGTAAVLTASVPLRDTLTLSDRLGPTPEWFLVGVALIALLVALLRAPRRRARTTREPGEAAPGGKHPNGPESVADGDIRSAGGVTEGSDQSPGVTGVLVSEGRPVGEEGPTP